MQSYVHSRPEMYRQLSFDVASVVASMEAGGMFVTEAAVTDQLKQKREYSRKPVKLLKKAVQSILDRRSPTGAGTASAGTPDAASNMKRSRVVGGSGEATPGTEPGYRSDSRGGGDSEPDKRRKKPAKALKLRLDRVEGEDDDEAVFGDKGGPDIPDRPRERYSDIGGLEASLHDVMEHVEWPLAHPELYSHIGVSPPRGVLLHGPSGCGKTLLAHAIGGELGVYFRAVSGPEVISGMSGESERKLRSLFTDAMANAPAILFIDEIDCIAGKRSNSQRGMDKRVVSQLLACIDSLNLDSTADGQAVIVIGACNHPDDLDPSLRRPGRFDREICLGVPDDAARAAVLRVLTRRMKLPEGFDYDGLARMTPGFVGADLAALTKEAAVMAVNRVFKSLFASRPVVASDTAGSDAVPVIDTMSQWIRSSPPLTPEQLEGLIVTQEDFTVASKRVQPSALREGFATIPDVTWADVGALEDVRAELQLGVVDAIRRPELFASLGIRPAVGVLLYGPPGCGKTLIAKAIANESRANFISVKGPELLDKYVGESERAVRTVFERARASAPCVVFFDELDALAPKRGGASSGSSGVTERVVNQLLTELNGVGERGDVFIVAATNRPDIIDSALLRPGRLDKLLYVPLPKQSDRVDILKTHVRHTPIAPDVDIADVARRCERYSGADLAGLVREAAMTVLRRVSATPSDGTPLTVTAADFEVALTRMKPSVSREDEEEFEGMYAAKSWSKLSGPK